MCFIIILLSDSFWLKSSISFKTQSPLLREKAWHTIHKFQGREVKVEAVIACVCVCVYSLSFHLCFSSNHPAPLNLNESSGSDKGRPYNPQQVQGRIREILGKYSNGFWVSKLPQIYRELYKQDLPTEAIKDLETWTHICTVCTVCLFLQSLNIFQLWGTV